MGDRTDRFWERKHLSELSKVEWESLCDGCAKCCLIKLEDEETGEIFPTRLHCRLLDEKTCQCSDYANRKQKVTDCVILTPQSVAELNWMPESCAYRRIHEGRALADWHHLICGDPMEIHRRGHSVIGQTVSEDDVFDEDQVDWLFDWEDNAS